MARLALILAVLALPACTVVNGPVSAPVAPQVTREEYELCRRVRGQTLYDGWVVPAPSAVSCHRRTVELMELSGERW